MGMIMLSFTYYSVWLLKECGNWREDQQSKVVCNVQWIPIYSFNKWQDDKTVEGMQFSENKSILLQRVDTMTDGSVGVEVVGTANQWDSYD